MITASQSPTEDFRSSIENNFIPNMLYSLGVANATWINNNETSTSIDNKRKRFLREVGNTV